MGKFYSVLMIDVNVIFDVLHGVLGEGLLYHGTMAITGFLLTLLGGKILKVFLNTTGRRLITKTKSDLDDKILEIVLSPLMAVFAITGAYFGMRELRKGFSPDNALVTTLIGNADAVLFILSSLIITVVLVRITKTVVVHMMEGYSKKTQTSLHHVLTPLLNRVLTFVIAALSIIVVMDHFGQNANSLLTLLGAGSLALGLAAQDTLSNMISGFVIMIDRPFHIGDRIKIPTGEEGDVYEIGMRSTTLLDFDNNLIVVPNNDLIRTRIVNYSYPSPEHRVVVDVSAAFGTDIDAMKSLMIEAAQNHPEVLLEPVPEAYLVNLGESSMQYKLICRVGSFRRKFGVGEDLRIAIYKKMMAEHIEIPLPQHVIHVKELPQSGITSPKGASTS
jgi:MscS family membrane protein